MPDTSNGLNLRSRTEADAGIIIDGMQAVANHVSGSDDLTTFSATDGSMLNAFGVHIIDFGTANLGANYSLMLKTDTGDSFTIAEVPPNLSPQNDIFFGILSETPFKSVSVYSTLIPSPLGSDSIVFDAAYARPVAKADPVAPPEVGFSATSVVALGLGVLLLKKRPSG
ncbi:MAG: hypothetical protein ACFB12_28455 [Leptolyngbyaceae cyanobacterium]